MKRLKATRVRKIVVLAVFVSIVVGLAVHVGWGTISSMGIGAVAYLCPLGALETFVASHTMVPRAVIALVVGLVVAALLGRAFCAWGCPVPSIQRFFHPSDKEKSGKRDGSAAADGEDADACAQCPSCSADDSGALAPIGGKRDGLRLDSRHGVLIGALLSSALFGFPVFCLVCPIGLSIALVIAVCQAVFLHSPTVSLVVFAAILLVEVVFFRKWCHRICPMGALMSLVGARAPLAKPHVDTRMCLRSHGSDCKACVQSCPELLDPHTHAIPECTRCAACAESCPAHAISLAPHKSRQSTGEDSSMPVR